MLITKAWSLDTWSSLLLTGPRTLAAEKQQLKIVSKISLVLWNLSITRNTEALSIPCLETSSSQRRWSLEKKTMEANEISLIVSPNSPSSCWSRNLVTEIVKDNTRRENSAGHLYCMHAADKHAPAPRIINIWHFCLISPPLPLFFFLQEYFKQIPKILFHL